MNLSSAFHLSAVLLALVVLSPRAATVVLTPVADTMLSEYFPNNNFGAMNFMNCGTSERGKRNRALLRFDLSAIPSGARIDAVALKLEIVRNSNNGYNIAQFDLHRLLVPWGEGDKTNAPGGPAGQGSPATLGDATWTNRFAFTTNLWTEAGGGATNDYVSTASAINLIYNTLDYTFASTALTIADVQLWHDQPTTNFGWIIVCANEDTLYTARRIGTREDPVNTPLLTIDYTPFVIQNSAVVSNQFQFTFTALAGRATTVQFNDSLNTTNWQPLANFPATTTDTNVVVTNSLSATQRFYRLTSP